LIFVLIIVEFMWLSGGAIHNHYFSRTRYKWLFAAIVAKERMSYFVAGLTNDDPSITPPVYKQYHHVQYNGTLEASATASVSFPPSTDMFRYVIIQQQFEQNNAICLAEVKVFLRGSLFYHI